MCLCVLVAQSYPTLQDLWTVARKAPLSMGLSRQEHWSGLPFPSPEDLPDPGIKPRSAALQAGSLLFELQGSPNVCAFQLSIHRGITYVFLRQWSVRPQRQWPGEAVVKKAQRFLKILLVFLATPCGLWILSSQIRDWTWATTVKILGPNHCIAREFPIVLILFY